MKINKLLVMILILCAIVKIVAQFNFVQQSVYEDQTCSTPMVAAVVLDSSILELCQNRVTCKCISETEMLITTYVDQACTIQNTTTIRQLTCVNQTEISYLLRCTNSNSGPDSYIAQQRFVDEFCEVSFGWVYYKPDYCIESVMLSCEPNGLTIANYESNSTLETCNKLTNSTTLPYNTCTTFMGTENFVIITGCISQPIFDKWWFWVAIGVGSFIFIVGLVILVTAAFRANKGYQVIN